MKPDDNRPIGRREPPTVTHQQDGPVPIREDTRWYLYQVFPVTPAPVSHVLLQGRTTVGRCRESGADVVVEDPQVSRCHACILVDGPQVMVRDEGSKNGVFVNAVRQSSADLRAGDLLRFGTSLFALHRVGCGVPVTLPQGVRFQGRSPAFLAAVEECRLVAKSSVTVLLTGETGTGKEELARFLHEASGRTGRFVAVNCAAVAPGMFEAALFGHRRGAFTGATSDVAGYARAAQAGTLFLDEIGEVPLETQAKLLRLLDRGEIHTIGDSAPTRADVRVVAATNRNLPAAVDDGAFRRDLYARLAVWKVEVPPLRSRPEDAVLIFDTVLSKTGHSLTVEAAEAIALYPWPYNVRELLAAAQEVAIRHPPHIPVTTTLLPESVRTGLARGDRPPRRGSPESSAPDREALQALFREEGGNIAAIARRLGCHRQQVYRWLKRYDIHPRDSEETG